MSFFKKLFSQDEAAKTAAGPKVKSPKLLRKERNQGNTYEVYKGDDVESAKEFLMGRRVDEAQYYIVVETPEGNWGMDVKGLYLERLAAFQKDLGSAQVDGRTCAMPDMFGLQMAARGINDNFIVKVECGKCQHQWPDALRYQNKTVVRCPKCKTLNKIDSEQFRVVLV